MNGISLQTWRGCGGSFGLAAKVDLGESDLLPGDGSEVRLGRGRRTFIGGLEGDGDFGERVRGSGSLFISQTRGSGSAWGGAGGGRRCCVTRFGEGCECGGGVCLLEQASLRCEGKCEAVGARNGVSS